MAPHNLYRCKGDDDWVAISCSTDEEWRQLATLLGVDDDKFLTQPSRKVFEDELDAVIGKWTLTKDQWEVTRLLQANGIAAIPSLDAQLLDTDPHLNDRGFIERLDHPVVGKLAHTGIPWIASNSPNGVRTPAPTLGQHTDQILSSLLSLTEDEIEALREAGVLG